ncbi:MAG TPA: PTS sugar transporter subunit IIB [Clostridiales bacterium]|nr:PTS sugar transporter subunit IIB [Clostridiales bacterium]
MKMKIQEEANNRNIDLTIDAIPMVELNDHLEGTSAILLGPQIRFALDDIKKTAKDIPVIAIAPQDFGMMNGKKVLDDLLKAFK